MTLQNVKKALEQKEPSTTEDYGMNLEDNPE